MRPDCIWFQILKLYPECSALFLNFRLPGLASQFDVCAVLDLQLDIIIFYVCIVLSCF
jgi:hypothetical protein